MDGADVEELQTNQKYFGENYYEDGYNKIETQLLEKIVNQTEFKILWSEPYANLYYYNNSIKTVLSNIETEKKLIVNPLFTL